VEKMGKTDAVAPKKTRKQRLREIHSSLRQARNIHLAAVPAMFSGPAFGSGVFVGVLAYTGVYSVIWLLRRYGGLSASGITLWLPLVGLLLAYSVAYFKGPYKTWEAKIYALLAAYDPQDKIAYQVLQDDVRKYGLEEHLILEWIDKERAAIAADAPVLMAKRSVLLQDAAELLETIERLDTLLQENRDMQAVTDLRKIHDELLSMLSQVHSGMSLSDNQRSQLHNSRDWLNERMNAGLGPIVKRGTMRDDPQQRFLNKNITEKAQTNESIS
jgi:hypothetical protein